MKNFVSYFILFIVFSFHTFGQLPPCNGLVIVGEPACLTSSLMCRFNSLNVTNPNGLSLYNFQMFPFPVTSTTPFYINPSNINYSFNRISWCEEPPITSGSYVLRLVDANNQAVCQSNVFNFSTAASTPSLLFRKKIGTSPNFVAPSSNNDIATCFYGTDIFLDIRRSVNVYYYNLRFTRVNASGAALAGYSPITVSNFNYSEGSVPITPLIVANTSGLFQISPNPTLNSLFNNISGTLPKATRYIKVEIIYDHCDGTQHTESTIFSLDIGCQEVIQMNPIKQKR
jgi:hypothetical protein